MDYSKLLEKINKQIDEKKQILAHQLQTARKVPDSFEAKHQKRLIAKTNMEIKALIRKKEKLKCN